MATILITGGFGFVGGRVAVHLAQTGYQVILGSRNAVTPPEWLPQAKVVQMLWDDVATLEKCCTGVDIVIHAAGMNAQDCVADPVAALAFNGVATARLVAVAKRAGVSRFIYFSTAHVYDSPLVGTITEEQCPRNLHPYATSHLAGEQAVLSATQYGTMQGIVLRLSNAFGAPTHNDVNCWMLLVNDLCKQAVQSHKLVLQTSGLQYRDFIGMSDVCRVTQDLVEIPSELLQTNLFNIGSGVSQTVLEIAQLIQQRSLAILGFEPMLHRPETTSNEYHQNLKFSNHRLDTLGIEVQNTEKTIEIDNLLKFCAAFFIAKKSPL
ncbi:NAD-dependent epimerase/dehydratase [Thiothrix litoralis]|uniref:NAD-dependent epimerase/dehydratase n=1 Tax=Thiothrix litoralis TaxID=2891210 RepID=A0ABX7WT95_9GAMM|nr:NAD-dependent epimerase/dehydratase [Thiothrix litoralis]QTR46426.1 NAD-dependent epimerase/dehydratase [Thiothrix litoralis]